ncbi:hypothetical protein [Streptococcus oriscaviae]|uniref:Uncharacterized protein n=1 Tax=Streptococcus oriscaviae TaxID=2781599 RepID=A0ABX7YID4_9STRE|nr:hypothetical protein [Streptococcus oriscaviae]QUE53376.1 hypothetical protein INT76_05680 [Streptococcus oriscaviae]
MLYKENWKKEIFFLDSLTVFIISLFIYFQKGSFWLPFGFLWFNAAILIIQLKKQQHHIRVHHILGESKAGFIYNYLKLHLSALFCSYVIASGLYVFLKSDDSYRPLLLCLLWVVLLYLNNIWIIALTLRRLL